MTSASLTAELQRRVDFHERELAKLDAETEELDRIRWPDARTRDRMKDVLHLYGIHMGRRDAYRQAAELAAQVAVTA